MKVFFLSIFLMTTPLAMATRGEGGLSTKEKLEVIDLIEETKAESSETSSQSQGVYSCVAGLKQSTEDRMDRELENLEKQVEKPEWSR